MANLNRHDLKKLVACEGTDSMKYKVCFLKQTESPFSGDLLDNKKNGTYVCTICKKELFQSNAKYNSGSGWPSFFQPMREDCLEMVHDKSLGMFRIEVCCANCGSHLGHVFEDGPNPTGKRYCINSVSLEFIAGVVE